MLIDVPLLRRVFGAPSLVVAPLRHSFRAALDVTLAIQVLDVASNVYNLHCVTQRFP